MKNDRHRHNIIAGSILAAGVIILGSLVYFGAKGVPGMPRSQERPLVNEHPDVRQVTLAFRVGGTISKMNFPVGAAVKQGDVLATLDRVPFEQALSDAKARAQLADADYTRARHIPDAAFGATEDARSRLDNAQHLYEVAHDEANKQRASVRPGEEGSNVYNDAIQNEHDTAQDVERAKRELSQQEDSGNVNRDAAKAALQSAQAYATIAETNLSYTQLVAPSDGTVLYRSKENGASVNAGDTVYTLALPSTPAP